MAGREMIRAAEIRTVVRDLNEISTGVNAFRTKFGCTPGDCANATTFIPGATNGDGDDYINSCVWTAGAVANDTGGNCWNNTAVGLAESFQFWYQLAQVGLIHGSYTGIDGPGGPWGDRGYIPGVNVMATSFDHTIGYTAIMWASVVLSVAWDFNPQIMSNIQGNIILLGTTAQADGLVSSGCCETSVPAFSPRIAWALDSKIDDGLPGQGNVLVFYPAIWVSGGYPSCVTSSDPGTANYLDTSTLRACALAVTNAF